MANVGLLVPQGLDRLPGTINEGHKYEYHLGALFGVRAALSDDVEDMWMATNVAGLGKFDDLVLFLKKRNEQDHHEMYLIQTKYKKNRNINLSSVDNNLQKYQDGYLEIKNDFSNGNSPLEGSCEFTKIKFVLFTRKKFISEGLKFQEYNNPKDVLNTGKIFRIPNDPAGTYNQDFLNQTLFYSKQIDRLHIENLIQKETETFFKNCDAKKILNFFEEWHNNEFEGRSILTKENIVSILLELAFSPYIQSPSIEAVPKADIWNEVTENFKLVSVKQQTHLPYIWSAVQLQMNNILGSHDIELLQWNEMVPEPSNTINTVKPHFIHNWYPIRKKKNSFSIKDLYILLWQNCSLPLVLCLHNNSSENVCKILSKLESVNSKRRYICLESVATDFPQRFTNFKSLNIDKSIRKKALKNIYISLQGKASVTLEKLKPNEAALEKITPDVFIELLQNDVKRHADDPTYVKRFLRRPAVSIKVLTLQDAVFVIVTDEKFYKYYKKFISFGQVIPWYLYKLCGNQFSHNFTIENCPPDSFCIIVKRGIDYFKKYKEIEDVIKDVRKSQDQTIHFFKFINDNEMEWLYSNRNADKIEPFLLPSNSVQYLPDAKLFDYITFNILSANAGEGKSTLLQFLANRCPADIWVVKLNIGEITKYIAEGDFSTIMIFLFNNSKDGFLPQEGEEFSWELFQCLFHELNILIVIDGLDEGEFNMNMKNFLNKIKSLGIKTIIASRPSLKDSLEEEFKTLSLFLKQLTSEECQLLIRRSIQNNCDMSQINKVIQKLSDWDNVVGIPLMLKLLVSLLNNGKPLDFDKFDITDLFETYINEQLSKLGKCNKSTQRTLSRSALFIFYNKEVISKLFKVEELFDDLEDKLDIYKESKLIEKLNSDKIPIFAHKSLAEFLVAQLISQLAVSSECTIIQNIVRSLFCQELEIVRLFFDIMTLKGSALQRIITDSSREHSGNEFNNNLVDKFKRNALHIVASYGNRCELRDVQSVWRGLKISEAYNKIHSSNVIEPGREFERRTVASADFFRKILRQKLNPRHQDDLFKFDAYDFALQSGSLDIVEVLYSENFNKEPQGINRDILLYHAVKNGYFNIYKFMKNKNFAVKISHFNDNLLHVALSAENFPIISELTKHLENIDEPNAVDHTPLISWLSSSKVIDSKNYLITSKSNRLRFNENQLRILQHLIKRKADINKRNAIGETPLHIISRCENKSVMEILIENGANVDKKTVDGNTPLHYAAQYSIENVKILVEHTSQIDTPNNSGYTPLCYAAQNNLQDIVELLLSREAAINRGKNGINPLNAAIAHGHLKCAELLISKSAKIINDKENNTLELAVRFGHLHCVKMLVNKGAKVFEKLLDCAVQNNHRDIITYFLTKHKSVFRDCKIPLLNAVNMNDTKTVQLLVSYGANINAKDESGNTSLLSACILGLRRIVEYLIEEGAELDVRNKSGVTPLYSTVIYGHLDCMKVIINKVGSNLDYCGSTMVYLAAREGHDYIFDYIFSLEIDINQRDFNGFVPVHTAVIQHDLKSLKNLLLKGANINLKTLRGGVTPLIIAATEGFQDMVEYLVEKGAELNEEGSEYHHGFRQTALTLASLEGHLECVQYLVAKGSNLQKYGPLALFNAASQRCFDVMDHLLSVDVDIDGIVDGDGASIHIAIRTNNLDAVKRLLEKGANVNFRTLLEGFTPLIVAVKTGYQDIVEFLIEYNSVRINEEDSDGFSALEHASIAGHLEIMKLLVNKGSDVNEYGPYALYLAAYVKRTDIVEYLIRSGADINKFLYRKSTPLYRAIANNGAALDEETANGVTVLIIASKLGHFECVKVLIDAGSNLTKYGPLAIGAATLEGHTDVVDLLRSACAQVDTNIPQQ